MLLLTVLLLGCRVGAPDSGVDHTDTSSPGTPAVLPACGADNCTTLEVAVRDVAPDENGGAWVLMAGLPDEALWPNGFVAPEGISDFLVHLDADNTIDVIESAGSNVDGRLQVSPSGDVLLVGTYRYLNIAGTAYEVPFNTVADAFIAVRESSGTWHVHQPWLRHHEVRWQTVTFTSNSDLLLVGWAPANATDPTFFGHVVPTAERNGLITLSLQDGLLSQESLPEFLDPFGVPSTLWVRDDAIYGRTGTQSYGGAIARLDAGHQWVASVDPRLGHNLFALHADPDPSGRIPVSVWVGNSQQPYIDGALTWTSASGATQEVSTVQVWQDWQSAWLTPDGEFETVDGVGGLGVAAHPDGAAWHPYIPNGGQYAATVSVSQWCRLGTGGTDCTPLGHDWATFGPDGTVWAWSRNYDVVSLEIRRP